MKMDACQDGTSHEHKSKRKGASMIQPGVRVEMTKGYKKTGGVVKEVTDSPYGFYVISLDNGINIIAGHSSFIIEAEKQGIR